ncbi:MAG TPA: helix-turn-helix domain-containing protein [Nocardioidaceae bacterium]|nr:helix-turn-helix domain-containing protein [Nocardioidaceae bacterium]
MTSLQVQARALGDPTRHRIFAYVAEAPGPVDIAELTEQFGFNHNAIRQHLAKLVDADLVVEGTAAARGRGRPRLIYRLDPTTESRWGVAGPYERLSLWLAEMVRTGDDPVEVGRRVGRSQAPDTEADSDPVASLADEMARHGFDPTVRQRGDTVDFTLRCCPFESTALDDPDTVCALHLGIAHGIAERTGGLRVDELIPKDPRRAGCRLHCNIDAEIEGVTT